jgi:hypothetical protein
MYWVMLSINEPTTHHRDRDHLRDLHDHHPLQFRKSQTTHQKDYHR